MKNLIMAAALFAAALGAHASTQPADALTRALGLPVRDALRVADSLSRLQSAPGWVRAQSLGILGDHRFVREEYARAAEFYQQASRFDNSSRYRHLYALAAALAGDTAAAAEIWTAIAADRSDGMSAEAAQLLAYVNRQSGAREEAAPVPVITISAVAPAAMMQAQPAAAPAPPPPPRASFTVQVGAFGSKDNADNLARRLAAEHGDVTVVPTATTPTLHRVWVGTFAAREAAVAFAEKLTLSGMTTRVVER
jgi:cell division protein FtsN